MTKSGILLFFIIILITQNDNHAQSFELVWSDEFSGTTLDASNWTRETGGSGWGNNELQYYTDRVVNAFVDSGYLTIRAYQETFGGRNYTSARLKTQGKRFFKYGKIEARIKLPYGQGIWPAFWMLGESISTVGWPACGELDIMEMIGGGPGRDNTVHGTAHWDNNGHQSYGQSYTLPSGNFSDDFHVFAIEWDATQIKWFMDGINFVTMNITPAYLTELRENSFIILNLAVGGNWPGNPNASTVFPQSMVVDYVRVYKDTTGQASINMLNPPTGSVFTPGQTIELTAGVTTGSAVRKVEFFQGDAKIGETNVSPYSMNWRDVQPGCYSVKAAVTTVSNTVTYSDAVEVKVGNVCGLAAYKGYPHKIPGKIEAENYDLGGNNVGYFDTNILNQGGAYRPNEGVDTEVCTDAGGGYNVGYVAAGEWLKYNINVLESTSYNFVLRGASNAISAGTMRIYIDDVDVTGVMSIGNTGGWQTWTNINKPNINLTQGNHVLKIAIESGEFNINYLNILKSASPTTLSLTSPAGGEIYQTGSIQEVTWESSNFDRVAIGLSTNNGASWVPINNDFPAEYGVCRFIVPNTPSVECKVLIIDKANSATGSTSANTFTITASTDAGDETAGVYDFALAGNFPNPFNPSTVIVYTVKEDSEVSLTVFDVMGNEIGRPASGYHKAGKYEAAFDGSGLSSGIYFYTLQAPGQTAFGKMTLLK